MARSQGRRVGASSNLPSTTTSGHSDARPPVDENGAGEELSVGKVWMTINLMVILLEKKH